MTRLEIYANSYGQTIVSAASIIPKHTGKLCLLGSSRLRGILRHVESQPHLSFERAILQTMRIHDKFKIHILITFQAFNRTITHRKSPHLIVRAGQLPIYVLTNITDNHNRHKSMQSCTHHIIRNSPHARARPRPRRKWPRDPDLGRRSLLYAREHFNKVAPREQSI